MKLTATLRITSAAVLSSLALAPFIQARHEKSLPPETLGFFQVNDIPGIEKRWEKHPLKADFEKLKLEEFFAPGLAVLKKKIGAEPKAGEALKLFERITEKLDGEALFAVVKTPKVEKGHLPIDFLLFADTALGEAEIAEMLKETGLLQEDETEVETDEDDTLKIVTRKVTEKFQGVTLNGTEVTAGDDESVNCGGWALVGKTFVYATAPNVLRELVDATQNGRKNNFTDQAIWKRSSDDIGKSDALFFLNTPAASAELRAYVVKQKETLPPEATFGMDILAAYDALGLDAVEAVWNTSTLEPEQVRGKNFLGFSEKRGLLSLITYKPLKTPVPSFIPGGVSSYAAVQWDMTQAWKNLEALLAKAVPALKPMLDYQLIQLKKDEGIDLRGDLLENFGDEFFIIADYGDGTGKSGLERISAASELYILSLRDQTKLESLIATALGKAGGSEALFEEREFMGVKIRTFKMPSLQVDAGTPPPVSVPYYAIFDGRAFIGQGNTKLLEKVIAEGKDSRDPLAKDANVQKGARLLTKDSVSFSYMAMDSIAGYLFGAVQAISEIAGREIADGEAIIDPDKTPDGKNIPWAVTAHTEERSGGFYSESILFRKVSAPK